MADGGRLTPLIIRGERKRVFDHSSRWESERNTELRAAVGGAGGLWPVSIGLITAAGTHMKYSFFNPDSCTENL